LGGYGSDGTSFRYDPVLKTWTQLATMTPVITLPADSCLGYNSLGEAIIVLFPDRWGSDTNNNMVYNIVHDSWSQSHVPAPMPSNGIWAPDVASDPDHNVCYVSGGATYPGAGDKTTLYAYYPATNTAQQLPSFTTARDYHASWFVPQWGTQGYVCIAGGANINLPGPLGSTQCYDIAQGAWHAENADLGPLPYGMVGMADALQVSGDTPLLWIMGGLFVGYPTRQTYYYDVNQSSWIAGPPLAFEVTAVEADTLSGELYVVGGTADYSLMDYNQHLIQATPPSCQQVPVFFDDFEGNSNWTAGGLWHTEKETDTCGARVASFPSPDTAWYYGSALHGCTYNTCDLTKGSLTLNATLPISGAQQITVTFQSYEQTSCGNTSLCYNFDQRHLDVSFDTGNTWETIWRGSEDAAWRVVSANSRFYPGNSMQLRFFFTNLLPGDDDYLGWFVDNVQVTACLEGSLAPQASFQTGAPACAGQTLVFTNTTTIGTPPINYTWDFGDGLTSTEISPIHTYTLPGEYTVTLTATNSVGSDATSQAVSVGDIPLADFNMPPQACQLAPVQFTNASSGATSFAWSFGDGGSSTDANPTHAYSLPGDFTAVLTATSACGSDTISHTLSVIPPPTAAFSYTPPSPLLGQPLQFSDLSSGNPNAWMWDFGDGYLARLQNPQHVFLSSGTYTVTLSASNVCGWGGASGQPIDIGEPRRVYLPTVIR
jgi:PKD repeat protein